ncbi:MAG: hypothetical protein DWQ42_19590 [Planctomycetota bacterium]|nr:MAG: hypothetical protein DWQ42_19590 [Planctomycetota bacterium]REK37518.1 MAG: hypothetical protein DWQ46_22070 [Planctomycetota bacterium]
MVRAVVCLIAWSGLALPAARSNPTVVGEAEQAFVPKPDTIDTTYFKAVTLDDLDLNSRSAMLVESMIAGPGLQCGMRQGDRVLAINGQRIYSRWEFDFHRNQLDRANDLQMTLIVNRNGHLLPLTIKPLMPGRRLGFYEGEQQLYLDQYVAGLGLGLPDGVAASLRRIPVRATYALMDWIEETEGQQRDLGWLQQFIQLRLALANQQWDKAQAPSQEIPVPYFRTLTDFYLSVAKRHAGGEQIPDPAAHNVSLAYYCAHYPFPKFAPPLGELTSTDAYLLAWIKHRHADPASQQQPTLPDGNNDFHRPRSPLDFYLREVKLALLWPTEFGNRPLMQNFRDRNNGNTRNVFNNDQFRQETLQQIQSKADQGDEDEAFYSYATVALYALGGDAESIIAAVRSLRALSPYMAYRAAARAQRVWMMKHGDSRNEELAKLLTYLEENPLQVTPRPSVFYRYVIPRSRYLQRHPDAFVGNPTQSNLIYNPIYFSYALGRKDTIAEEATALDAAIAADDIATSRTELLERLERLAIPFAVPADMRRLADLGRDGMARGQVLDTFNRIVYGSFLSNQVDYPLAKAIAEQILERALWTTPQQTGVGDAYVRDLIASLGDENPEVVRESLLAAHADHGDLVATCRIAATLQRFGFTEEAAAMRDKVDRFVYALLSRTQPNPEQRLSFNVASLAHHNVNLAALCGWDDQLASHRDLYHALREYFTHPNLEHEVPAYLLVARHELARGKLKRAIAFLSDSFSAQPGKACRSLYVTSEGVTDSDDGFREYLVRGIVRHEAFTDDLRAVLIKSNIVTAMPELAAELGLSRESAGE